MLNVRFAGHRVTSSLHRMITRFVTVVEFPGQEAEAAFSECYRAQLICLDVWSLLLLIPFDCMSWVHLVCSGQPFQRWRYLSPLLGSLSEGLVRYHLFSRKSSYESRRDLLLCFCKVASVAKIIVLHRFALQKPFADQEDDKATLAICGAWPVLMLTPFFFRQKMELHLPCQVATMAIYMMANAWMFTDLQRDPHLRPAVHDYVHSSVVQSVAAYLPPPWPGCEETPENNAIKVWAAAQLVLGTLLPSYMLYFLERRTRIDFATRYQPPGRLPSLPSSPPPVLDDNMHLVFLQLLLMAGAFVCIWYKPFLALLLV